MAAAKLLTLLDEEFASSVTIQMLNCGALANGTVGYCMFAQGEFHLVEICQGGGGGVDNPRIRFRLQNGFADTGEATAVVLNTYGTTTVSPGDVVTVCDTQKQFAQAIGSNDVTINQSTVFPCGGSLGFAVETERVVGACTDQSGVCTDNVSAQACAASNGTFQAYKNCAGDDVTPVKRWEVEQCSQTINKMHVYVYRNDAVHSQPTGQTDPNQEGPVTLYFNDAEAILSRYPNVDYDLGIEENTDSNVPYNYKIEADNDGRFSAIQGSAVTIQAVPRRQRVEDGCNDATPYGAQAYEPTRWQIEEVHKPLARWIKVIWKGAVDKWEYDTDWLEGDDPSFYFENGVQDLNDSLQFLPSLDQTCLKLDEPGWAFWDPNTQKYNVAITRSALYGTATSLKMIGDKASEPGELLDFDECDLKYKETKPWFVFGDGDECAAETTDKTASADVVPVTNIYDVSRVGDYLNFSYNTIYVCKTDPGGDIPLYICCDDEPTGCCELSDGTYLPDQTESQCDAQNGTYLGDGSECPSEGCCEITEGQTPAVSAANFEFGFTTVGVFNPGSSSFSPSGPCGVTLTFEINWTNLSDCDFGFSETNSATAVLKHSSTDSCCYWEITLTEPTAECLKTDWPGEESSTIVVKVPNCGGEINSNCNNHIGGCEEGCDNAGLNAFPSFLVSNIGGCIA